MSSSFVVGVGLTLAQARKDGHMTWEYINQLWHDRFAPDRRYKLWFKASTVGTYIMQVSKVEVIVVFLGDSAYVREFSDKDKYCDMPCYEISPCGGGWRIKYQSKVCI